MLAKILTLLLLVGHVSFGQINPSDCTKKLDQELLIIKGGNDSLLSDIKVFQQCCGLDSVDTNIFCSGPALGMMIISLTNDHKKITYREILNLIQQFRNAPGYLQLREEGVPETPKNQLIYKKLESVSFIDLNDAIQRSKVQNKQALIYFTGFSSANSVRMEQGVFQNEEIRRIIAENFIVYRAYVDDNTKIDGKTTVGNRNLKIEKEIFKQEAQPFFVIVNYNAKITAEFIGSTDSVNEFTNFLNKGLSKK